jgi:cytoskeletal protein CcmA (bactofilin family)
MAPSRPNPCRHKALPCPGQPTEFASGTYFAYNAPNSRHQGMGQLTNQPAPTRTARSHDGSFIAAGATLEGNLSFSGSTAVAGHLKGDVSADSLLVIEHGAVVEGNVTGTVIIVHGTIKGSVCASEIIEAWPGCRLEGRAYAPSMRVDAGASILADLMIAPNRPADWLPGTSAAPAAPAPTPVRAEPAAPFTNTMFAPPAKTGS